MASFFHHLDPGLGVCRNKKYQDIRQYANLNFRLSNFGGRFRSNTRRPEKVETVEDFLERSIMALVVFIAMAFLTEFASGYMTCEQLPLDRCSYAIASSGRRCVLEKYMSVDGSMQMECKTSPVTVGFMEEWIETEDCIKACGLDRKSLGISSDNLLGHGFIKTLCSRDCYQNCPNIADLYSNLALAEGGFLPDICLLERNPKRMMKELENPSDASGPSAAELAPAAAPSKDHNHHLTAYPPVAAPY
ncbi:hypothetical protein MLD38_006275 [Melastoma candidum]|uniref:Uncharacterized protein n=1 Tax=Melastoma candidum TaxID=119954 RepID=A0ACB9RQD6_9MYRT|nr:hypothetical protein MLD38_006275 [Melastoma candidum]